METIQQKEIDFDEEWKKIEEGITKIKNILKSENSEKQTISTEEWMMLYTIVTNMCTQKGPPPANDYPHPQLYDKYRESLNDYIKCTVLPSLEEKNGEFLLRELVKSWSNHKIMKKWLIRIFQYLERYYISRRRLPSLDEVGVTCFRTQVYAKLYGKVIDAVVSLIDKEREGEQIDRALVKNVVDIFVKIDASGMDKYVNHFEAAMLNDTATYYSRKAATWISDGSSADYLMKAEESLKQEKARVFHYLHSSTEPKLLEKVQRELLTTYANHLPEKDLNESKALLRDDMGQDLSGTYLLFSNIPTDLESVANKVMQHATTGGATLVEKAET